MSAFCCYFFLGAANLHLLFRHVVCNVILLGFLHVTFEGSAFIVSFLDMRKPSWCVFLTVLCRFIAQVSATKRTRMEGHNLYVTSVCSRWSVLIFA